MRLEVVGLVLIIVGITLILLSAIEGKFAFVGFIGPIPFGFGNDPKLLKFLLVISAVVLILLILGAHYG